MEEINPNPCTRSSACMLQEKKARPKEQLNCPRCKSSNTKFCYYNNYSLTQPRYFCKSCRRYWTEGGSLRNVPVGGGSRKKKKPSAMPSSSSTDHHLHAHSNLKLPNPGGRDLNLAFPPAMSHYAEVPKVEDLNCEQQNSAMELAMRSSGSVAANFMGRLSSFEPNLGFNNPFPTEFSFSVNGYGGLPFEQLSQQQHSAVPDEAHHHQNERQGSISTGLFWSRMLGDGSL